MSSPQDEFNPYAPSSPAPAETFTAAEAFGSEEAMRRVAKGLNLVYIGIALIVLSIVGGAFFVSILVGFGVAGLGAVAALVMMLGILAGTVTGLAGRILCLAVPEATGAQGWIYAAVVCDVAALLIALAELTPIAPAWLERWPNLLSMVATVLFVIFMKRVASDLGRLDLSEKAQSLITLGAILFVLSLGAMVAGVMFGPAAALLGLAILVLGFVIFIRYLRLIRSLRGAILGET